MNRKFIITLSVILTFMMFAPACSNLIPSGIDVLGGKNMSEASGDSKKSRTKDDSTNDSVMEVYMGSDTDYKTPDGFAYFTSIIETSSPLIALGEEDAKKYPNLNATLKEYSLKWCADKESRMQDLEENVIDDLFAMDFHLYGDFDFDEFYESGATMAECKDSLNGRLMRADGTVFPA